MTRLRCTVREYRAPTQPPGTMRSTVTPRLPIRTSSQWHCPTPTAPSDTTRRRRSAQPHSPPERSWPRCCSSPRSSCGRASAQPARCGPQSSPPPRSPCAGRSSAARGGVTRVAGFPRASPSARPSRPRAPRATGRTATMSRRPPAIAASPRRTAAGRAAVALPTSHAAPATSAVMPPRACWDAAPHAVAPGPEHRSRVAWCLSEAWSGGASSARGSAWGSSGSCRSPPATAPDPFQEARRADLRPDSAAIPSATVKRRS